MRSGTYTGGVHMLPSAGALRGAAAAQQPAQGKAPVQPSQLYFGQVSAAQQAYAAAQQAQAQAVAAQQQSQRHLASMLQQQQQQSLQPAAAPSAAVAEAQQAQQPNGDHGIVEWQNQ